MCNQSQGYYGSNNTLSPAAQAVVDAYWATPSEPITTKRRLPRVAAALRAAATMLRDAYANEEYVDPADDWLDDIAAELEAS
jgi:hypothetical protein